MPRSPATSAPCVARTMSATVNGVARLIWCTGGPDMAPRPPTLGRAPAKPWPASGSPHKFSPPASQNLTRDGAVVERQRLAADDLVALVALAGDHHGVASARPVERAGDGPAAVDLGDVTLLGAGHTPEAGHDLVEDRLRRLRARVVGGDPGAIGQTRGDLSHDRPLGAVAIPAAAEHHR